MAVKFASAIDAASWNHLERAEIGPGDEQAATLSCSAKDFTAPRHLGESWYRGIVVVMLIAS
jgi:hypothetical protein